MTNEEPLLPMLSNKCTTTYTVCACVLQHLKNQEREIDRLHELTRQLDDELNVSSVKAEKRNEEIMRLKAEIKKLEGEK